MVKRIGIMGGTFNPIHNAHLVLGECSYEQFDLDAVWFMPSKNPPHKLDKNIASQKHRSNMIIKAIEDNPHFEFSDFELSRQGTTYTAETLTLLKEEYRDTYFFFILGEDSLFNIENWKTPELIFEQAHIITARRGSHRQEEIYKHIKYLNEKYQDCKISILDTPMFEISSHFIRDNIKEDKSIRYYVPKSVKKYIKEKNLYIGGEVHGFI